MDGYRDADFQEETKWVLDKYRPISLTLVLGKQHESIIRDKTELSWKPLIKKDSQQAFRNKRSCLPIPLISYNDLFSVYNLTMSPNIICIDFQKVFDKASHNKSLYKVKQVGY